MKFRGSALYFYPNLYLTIILQCKMEDKIVSAYTWGHGHSIGSDMLAEIAPHLHSFSQYEQKNNPVANYTN